MSENYLYVLNQLTKFALILTKLDESNKKLAPCQAFSCKLETTFVNINVDPWQLAWFGPNAYLRKVGKSQNRNFMAKRLSARIRPKNQITLPQRLVEHTGLKEGDFLDFEIVTTAQQIVPGMIVLRTKRLIEAELPTEPIPPLHDGQEFPGVKTAIAELKKRLQ